MNTPTKQDWADWQAHTSNKERWIAEQEQQESPAITNHKAIMDVINKEIK